MAASTSLLIIDAGPLAQRFEGTGHILGRGNSSSRRRKQDNFLTRDGKLARVGRLAQNALRSVAHNRVSQPFGSSEGDPTWIAFAAGITYNHSNQRMVQTFPLSEHPLEVPMGLDGLHASQTLFVAHGQTLAALGATCGQDGTTTLGSHAGTETVALGALALIRLISALHIDSLSNGQKP